MNIRSSPLRITVICAKYVSSTKKSYHDYFAPKWTATFENTGRHSLNYPFNTLRPRQNGRHFTEDLFKYIILNENIWISIKISLKFVPKVPINNNAVLVQVMAWHRSLSEPIRYVVLAHICVTRSQWVNIRSKRFRISAILHKNFARPKNAPWLAPFKIRTAVFEWQYKFNITF